MNEKVKDWVQVVQSVLTSLAILCAGWYFLYKGEATSKLLLAHDIQSVELHPNTSLLDISLKLENTGSTSIRVSDIKFVIFQVKPLSSGLLGKAANRLNLVENDQRLVKFPVLRSTVIEHSVLLRPGESEVVTFDATVPSTTSVVRVYSFVNNPRIKDIGWKITSLHTLRKG